MLTGVDRVGRTHSCGEFVDLRGNEVRKADIRVGERYTDGKGNAREVISEGPEFTLYRGQAEKDNLRYRVVAKRLGPLTVGEERNSTRASFASWARDRVRRWQE